MKSTDQVLQRVYSWIRSIAAIAAVAMTAPSVWAVTLAVQVTDSAGQAVPDAVVYAEMENEQGVAKSQAAAQIQQKDRKFLPLVTVIQTGGQISFPNNDTVRHHIYSFSAPKKFEQKLYSGVAASPVTFDKAGTVVLGCNIHDKMVAYIQVVDTPHFGKTDAAGKFKLDDLAPGKYMVRVWHYNLPMGAPIPEQAVILKAEAHHAVFKLGLKAVSATITDNKSPYSNNY